MNSFSDGTAGDTNYGAVGEGYARIRQPDRPIVVPNPGAPA